MLLDLLAAIRGSRAASLAAHGSVAAPEARCREGSSHRRCAKGGPLFGLLPEMRAVHPQDPNWPDECTFLLQNSFVSLDASARGSLRSYVRYLFDHDMRPEYRHYRQQLQLLAWKWSGDHWVLKTPVHLLALEALLASFPTQRSYTPIATRAK